MSKLLWSVVRNPRNGEPVDQATAGRPSSGLARRTELLRDRLDGLANRESVRVLGLACREDCRVGTPVYYNTATGLFEPSRWGAGADPATRILVAVASAAVIGVVSAKPAPTVADLTIVGRLPLDVDEAAAVGITAPGLYRLSGTAAGRYLAPPSPGPEVLFWDGEDAYVRVVPVDLSAAHAHFRFELTPDAAGTVDDTGDAVAINDADSALPGWLPADHAVFAGQAPAGAKFGYNLAADVPLSRAWPPTPLDQAAIVMFAPELNGLGQEVPLGVGGLAAVDAYGIWWMSDCAGQVPWSAVPAQGTWLSGAPTDSLGSQAPCPLVPPRRLFIHFAKIRYASDRTAVTSLTPYDPTGPVRIVGFDGAPATAGDLRIVYDPALAVQTTTARGGVVVKEILSGGRITRGSVVEGIVAGNDSVTLSGSVQVPVDPADEASGTMHQGLVRLVANVEPGERLLSPQLLDLDDALERPDNLTIGLPEGQASGVTYKFRLPGPDQFPAAPKCQVRLWLTGSAAATLPALTLTQLRVPRTTTPAALPSAASAVAVTTAVTIEAGQYVEVTSAEFAVAAGDVVVVSVARSVDAYAGEVGIVDAVLRLFPG